MARILGIDYGDVRTGVAVSDPNGSLAFGVCTLTEYNEDKLILKICSVIQEKNAEKVVVGLPVNMDGSKGFRAEKVLLFAKKLEGACGVPVEFHDERCSTMMAHKILNETDTRGKKRKKAVDTLSAEIILQSYLDKISFENSRKEYSPSRNS